MNQEFDSKLGGRFEYFSFFCSGEGRGSPRCQEGAVVGFFIEKSPGGGVLPREGGVCQGAGGCLQGIWGGGGAKYFLFGAEMPAK